MIQLGNGIKQSYEKLMLKPTRMITQLKMLLISKTMDEGMGTIVPPKIIYMMFSTIAKFGIEQCMNSLHERIGCPKSYVGNLLVSLIIFSNFCPIRDWRVTLLFHQADEI